LQGNTADEAGCGFGTQGRRLRGDSVVILFVLFLLVDLRTHFRKKVHALLIGSARAFRRGTRAQNGVCRVFATSTTGLALFCFMSAFVSFMCLFLSFCV
jgi:hypothetical protein